MVEMLTFLVGMMFGAMIDGFMVALVVAASDRGDDEDG